MQTVCTPAVSSWLHTVQQVLPAQSEKWNEWEVGQ